jgi:excisionase family DNA binding protein
METAMMNKKATKDQHVGEQREAGQLLAPKWDEHDTFTVEEAGTILRISRGSAYAAAKSGALPVVDKGRLKRVPRRALERMLGGNDVRGAHRANPQA